MFSGYIVLSYPRENFDGSTGGLSPLFVAVPALRTDVGYLVLHSRREYSTGALFSAYPFPSHLFQACDACRLSTLNHFTSLACWLQLLLNLPKLRQSLVLCRSSRSPTVHQLLGYYPVLSESRQAALSCTSWR